MIIIADSGSTKTNWLVLSKAGEELYSLRTEGLNPAVFPKELLEERIFSNKELVAIKGKIEKVNFFGAGCGTEAPTSILLSVLESIFTNAKITIKEDTAVAVYATADKKPAIVCILGTGSNCSYFDGETIHQKIVSLGYIIMDDASGNYYGKQLLRDYYFGKMPKDLADKFEERFNLDADFIKENLYRKSNPNTYLACFGHFMVDYKAHTYHQELIKKGLRLFVENQVFQYEKASELPIHFVGSIAYFLRNEIAEVLKEYNLTLGVIERHPIRGLVKKHFKVT
ncbi:MAG: N-acetylglucosamine kinase [Flavobacteriaceae bacterium]|nr:N-acetylglucosamine kinase [Flavobacteriaceae bacterium]